MSIFKQILGALLVLLVVAGGIFAYERMAAGSVVDEAMSTGQAARGAPVELASAELRVAEDRIEAVGSTMALQAIEVVPLASGQIRELSFEPGEAVAAGDVLAQLDDEIEQANLAEAEAAYTEAELALDRARTLRESRTVAQSTLEELIAREAASRAALDRARRRLADRTVRAPFDGIVGLKQVDEGARVDDTTVITTLDDRSVVQIEFSLPETLYGHVSTGQQVIARSAAFQGQRFEGAVTMIDSRIERTSRSFKVRARLPNPDLILPSGMFMHLTVILSSRQVVMVPEEAIVAEGEETYVFVAGDGAVARRGVELGQRQVGRVEIVNGLAEGEQVVTSGTIRLSDGAPIQVIGEASESDGSAEPESAAGRV